MDERRVLDSCLFQSEDRSDSLYPMFFGVSCAFFALRLLSEPEMNDKKWSEVRDRLLQGSAHLLGLLVWRVQREEANSEKSEILKKLDNAVKEIEELKRRRGEDAKANEKVVGIFATQEQRWLSERKKLQRQIGALLNELRVLQTSRGESLSELNSKLQEKELSLQSKDEELAQEVQKRREVEEKLHEAGTIADELREKAKREAQEHSSEIWKHKTAFIKLVSNQRQLEAEMRRALRQAEAAKQELDSVLAKKEESILMAQKLSMELIKAQKELEQKDKILSAMLRKSKLDTAEKQMLLKEVKLSKAMRNQAELDTGKWTVSESRRERHSLKSMLSRHASSKLGTFSDERGIRSNVIVPSLGGKVRSQQTDFLLQYEQPEHLKESENFSPLHDQYLHESEELADVKQLESWVQSEKYTNLLEQRHQLEINAFAEQLRLKDEKLEDFHWRLLSMELESKRLHVQIEGLNHDLLQLRQQNIKINTLLLDRETELNSLKQQLVYQLQPLSLERREKSCPQVMDLAHETISSGVKVVSKMAGEKEQETNTILVNLSQEMEPQKVEENSSTSQSKDVMPTFQSPRKEFEEEKNPSSDRDMKTSQEEIGIVEKRASSGHCSSNSVTSPWRMDLHALGVSYKIKRLKQQLLMLERLTGKQESCQDTQDDDNMRVGTKEFHVLMSLLSKQVSRYQSLQAKTDELCKRMHENDLDVSHGGSHIARTKKETKILEHFLEETFQLQRYVVATGQKLMEIQSKIASAFVDVADGQDMSDGFDVKRFADTVRTLFREVQRGFEVRIARIIGDLEGTLACDGMIHLRK